jgi:cytochrome c553
VVTEMVGPATENQSLFDQVLESSIAQMLEEYQSWKSLDNGTVQLYMEALSDDDIAMIVELMKETATATSSSGSS